MDFLAHCRHTAASVFIDRVVCFFNQEDPCMMVNRRIILIVVALLLGGYVFVYEIQGSKKGGTGAEQTEKIFYFDPHDVEEMEITRENQTVLFRKEGKDWSVIRPKIHISNVDKRVYDLLSIFDYGIVDVIERNPSDISQYGLEKPKIRFSIKIKGDSKHKKLLIGDNNPTGMSCYAMVAGKQSVLQLGIMYKLEMTREIEYFLKQS